MGGRTTVRVEVEEPRAPEPPGGEPDPSEPGDTPGHPGQPEPPGLATPSELPVTGAGLLVLLVLALLLLFAGFAVRRAARHRPDHP